MFSLVSFCERGAPLFCNFNFSVLLLTVKGEALNDSRSSSPEETDTSAATQLSATKLPSADQVSIDRQALSDAKQRQLVSVCAHGTTL